MYFNYLKVTVQKREHGPLVDAWKVSRKAGGVGVGVFLSKTVQACLLSVDLPELGFECFEFRNVLNVFSTGGLSCISREKVSAKI